MGCWIGITGEGIIPNEILIVFGWFSPVFSLCVYASSYCVLRISVKSFVDYFADTYKEKTGGYYKKTYAADNAIFAEIGKFFSFLDC